MLSIPDRTLVEELSKLLAEERGGLKQVFFGLMRSDHTTIWREYDER